ncbi:hypothetical protein ABZW18_05205 [Streptomyces sp. NPDC004647]|uniref:hypothetical protein n=1 Tax=Streptomyces sp. NPDC004647 TaxID=3154671 RepID=UPI0033A8FA5F
MPTIHCDTTQAAAHPEPEKATAKAAAPAKPARRVTKRPQSTAQEAEPKKKPANPRSRRATSTAAKTTKAKDTNAQQKPRPAEATTSN